MRAEEFFGHANHMAALRADAVAAIEGVDPAYQGQSEPAKTFFSCGGVPIMKVEYTDLEHHILNNGFLHNLERNLAHL
jgi:hypothetical protein